MLKTRDENSGHLWSLPEILHEWFQFFQPWCQLGNKRGKLPLAQTLLEQFVGESTQMVRGNTCECELLIIVAKLLWLRCSRHCYEKSLEENSSNRAVETRHAARQAAGNCQYLSVEVPERLVPSRRLRKLWTWRSADNPSDERFAPRNVRITLSKSVEFSLQAVFGKAAVSNMQDRCLLRRSGSDQTLFILGFQAVSVFVVLVCAQFPWILIR